MRMLRIGLIVSLLGCVVACGADAGNKDGVSGREEKFVGEEKSVMVKAAEGGELSVGVAALTIPKGALSEDTEISVKVESRKGRPDEDNVLMEVYDFGPDGQKFNMPVTLEFDVADVNVSSKGKAMIAWQNGEKWETLPTKIQDGKATAATTHFTPFTLVFVLNEDGDVVQAGGQCGGDFEACGGDLVGEWTFSGACATLPPGGLGGSGDGENPFAMCEVQPSASLTIDITGTASFAADGTFVVDQLLTTSFSLRIPQSCLDDLSAGGPAPKCEDINLMTAPDGDGCLSEDADEEPQMNMETGTYTVEGTTVVITGDDGEPGDPASFCVTGDTLTVHGENEDGSVFEYTATRN
jgi:hypothetical protein